MKRSLSLAVALALGAGPLLSGCKGQSRTCGSVGCTVRVQGAGQTVDLDGVRDVNITITAIGGGAVTMSVDGSPPVRLRSGAGGQVGPVAVQVISVKGDTVEFDVR